MTNSRHGASVFISGPFCHVGLVLWLFAWTGFAQTIPQTSNTEQPPIDAPIAEPISPDTIKRFGHLAPYGGHILLAGKDLQVVLAGVPSSPNRSLWHGAILAAYELDTPSSWKRLLALPPVDLHIGDTGESAGALAVDLNATPKTGAVSATFLFGDDSRSDSLRAATYHFTPDQGRLTVFIHSVPNKKYSRLTPVSTEPGKLPPTPSNTSLRIRPIYGSEIPSFLAESADPSSSKPLSLPAFWLYNKDSVVSLIGPKALREEAQQDGSIVLKYVAKGKEPALPFEGFAWLLGRRHTGSTAQHQIDIAQCLYGERRPKTWPQHDPVSAYVEACSPSATSAKINLSLSAKDPGGTTTPYPVFIFDEDGRPRGYTVVFAGETIDLSVPPEVPVRLANTAFGRLIETLTDNPKTVSLGQSEKVDLPPRQTALIRVDGPEHGRPAVFALKRVDGVAWVLGAKDGFDNGCVVLEREKYVKPVASVENGVFLAPKWPVYCELLGDAYDIHIASGGEKQLCHIRAYPDKDHPQVVQCGPQLQLDDTRLLNKYSYFDLAFPGDSTRKIDLGTASESKSGTKDLSLLKSSDVLSESADQRANWLGASYLAEPWGIERFFKSNFKLQDARASSSFNLPVLRVIDEGSGIAIQYFPATGELIRIFQKFKLRRPDDSVGALIDTIQTAESDGFLEIGCPNPAQSLFDYELLVRRVQPDGLRLFGCASDIPEKSLVALWARLSLEAEKPYVLTAGSPMDVLPYGGYPRLVAKNSEEKTMDDSLLSALTSRKTLATRGPILQVTVKSAESTSILDSGESPKGAKRPKAPTKPYSYVAHLDIDRAPEPSLGKVKVEIFSDKGSIKTVDYPLTTPIPGKLTIPFASDTDIKWLRAELTTDQSLGNDAPSLLAATNWITVTRVGVLSQPALNPPSAAKTKRL